MSQDQCTIVIDEKCENKQIVDNCFDYETFVMKTESKGSDPDSYCCIPYNIPPVSYPPLPDSKK